MKHPLNRFLAIAIAVAAAAALVIWAAGVRK
jgi:hypothetical protein